MGCPINEKRQINFSWIALDDRAECPVQLKKPGDFAAIGIGRVIDLTIGTLYFLACAIVGKATFEIFALRVINPDRTQDIKGRVIIAQGKPVHVFGQRPEY